MQSLEEKRVYQKAYQKTYKRKYRDRREYHKSYRKTHKEKPRNRKAYLKAYGKIYGKEYRQRPLVKEMGRARDRKRQALKFGNSHASYADIEIFERDAWICGICGQKINKRLKYPHPRSKSIDHIVPLCRGGADAPINLQAAHLRCNIGKNAKAGGQLRLIG